MSKKADLGVIKKINQELVLDLIRREQPISRAQIARKLQLSRSTVSSIVDGLMARKFLVELGTGSSTKDGGKPAIQLGFNPRSGYGIGIDIGGTKILLAITDLNGSLIYSEKFPITGDLKEIYMIIHNAMQRVSISEEDVVAIGFGVPGITDTEQGVIVEAPAHQWKNLHFKEEMAKFFQIPIFINNDVNCAAVGERWLGAAQQIDDLVYIAIGTGVGGAIVSRGNLVQGHQFMAGEVGYLLEKGDIKEQKRNRFGDYGVFEKKVSGRSLSKVGFTPKTVFTEYAQGNLDARQMIDEFMMTLSVAIANIVSLLNPEKVIIGGGVSQSMECVLEGIRSIVSDLTPVKTTINLASLGEQSVALGAIAFAFEKVRETKGGEYN